MRSARNRRKFFGCHSVPHLAAHPLAGYRRSDMTNSKLRFGFPLAIALATASATAVAHGKCESSGCSGDAKITTKVQTLIERHPDLGAPGSITAKTRAGGGYVHG